ncbi:MAG TPA: hypothetical protein DDY59_00010 [Lachnospiraceae bacterium]|nr:hypothetical protein [Lachnospiraceae bacterium]
MQTTLTPGESKRLIEKRVKTLPIAIRDTGSAMAVMLMFIPVIIALLFFPTIFIFYNSTAWVYIIAYGVIAAIGNFIGKLFFKA